MRPQVAAAIAHLRKDPAHIRHSIRMMMLGNWPAELAPLHALARVLNPEFKGKARILVMTTVATAEANVPQVAVLAAYKLLSRHERIALDALVDQVVSETREEFYEGFPKFRPPADPQPENEPEPKAALQAESNRKNSGPTEPRFT